MAASFRPRLSVVATSRNDDHGGNPLARTQIFIDGLADQARRLALPMELVLVEWNPPADRPPLAAVLRWRRSAEFQPVVVTVPEAVHRSLANADKVPLHQMIGKNVGIRRSRAALVLATNIDILLSDELVAFIRDEVRPNAMYRVDRLDVMAPLDRNPLPSPAECRALPVLRTHDIEGVKSAVKAAPHEQARRSTGAVDEAARLARGAWNRLVLPKLHTAACGDFTLTSGDVWSAIRGYPEWPIYPWHVDGLALFQAFAAGTEMVNLPPPMVAFHLEHGMGSGWTPEGARRLFERMDAQGVPYLSTDEYRRLARKIVRSRGNLEPFNDRDWGFAARDLPTAYPE